MFKCLTIICVVTLTCTVADVEGVLRHAYVTAIPFADMKLNASVLTSYEKTSRAHCVIRCLERSQCQSINYYRPALRCDLLADYLCTKQNNLITALGYSYYDVEKNENPQNVTEAHAQEHCKSEGRCSPKCPPCTVIGYLTYLDHQLVPDDAVASRVPSSTSKAMCMYLCSSKPLPQCRGVNVHDNPHVCEHVTFLRSERSPDRYINDNQWEYNQRDCIIY